MEEERKIIGEKIIMETKANGQIGMDLLCTRVKEYIQENFLHSSFDSMYHIKLTCKSVIDLLKSYQLIESNERGDMFTPTERGYEFTTFKEYERKKREKEEREQLLSNLQIRHLRFLLNYDWAIALGLVILSAVLSWLLVYLFPGS